MPGYSEVYPVEDLIWDNTNKALLFRKDILNLHRLDDARLEALLERLEDSELDDYPRYLQTQTRKHAAAHAQRRP